MYWKKKTPQSVGGVNFKNQPFLENEHGLPKFGLEMTNRKPLASTSHPPASVKATMLDKEKNEDGPTFECNEPVDGYAEMSWMRKLIRSEININMMCV